MLKPRILPALTQVLLFALLVNLAPISSNMYAATCTGSDPCNACKNCHYCRHCAKEGGKCGVCK